MTIGDAALILSALSGDAAAVPPRPPSSAVVRPAAPAARPVPPVVKVEPFPGRPKTTVPASAPRESSPPKAVVVTAAPIDEYAWDHSGASRWDRPGPSKDPVAAINAARAQIGRPPLARHPALDAMARKALDDYRATGVPHGLVFRLDLIRSVGWDPTGPGPPGVPATRGWARNYSECQNSGYLCLLLGQLAAWQRTNSDEPHAVDFRSTWTHVGYAENPTGEGQVIWYGYQAPDGASGSVPPTRPHACPCTSWECRGDTCPCGPPGSPYRCSVCFSGGPLDPHRGRSPAAAPASPRSDACCIRPGCPGAPDGRGCNCNPPDGPFDCYTCATGHQLRESRAAERAKLRPGPMRDGPGFVPATPPTGVTPTPARATVAPGPSRWPPGLIPRTPVPLPSWRPESYAPVMPTPVPYYYAPMGVPAYGGCPGGVCPRSGLFGGFFR